jgi:hypothetical protein
MMPHCKLEAQYEIFQDVVPALGATPKLVLPFQLKDEIDVRRIGRILGVEEATARRMVKAKLFRRYQVAPLTPWRIEYDSVVDYCNRLRLEYRISPRLKAPAPGRRHRDEDLLPFPLAESLSIKEVRDTLRCERRTVLHLIETGSLTGYRIYPEELAGSASRWRIWRRSLLEYIGSLHASAAPSISLRDRSGYTR